MIQELYLGAGVDFCMIAFYQLNTANKFSNNIRNQIIIIENTIEIFSSNKHFISKYLIYNFVKYTII